jgi:hypothetical protein
VIPRSDEESAFFLIKQLIPSVKHGIFERFVRDNQDRQALEQESLVPADGITDGATVLIAL